MILAVLLWLVAIAVTAGFGLKRWWFPAGISQHATRFDSIFSTNLWIAGFIFLAAQIALGVLIWRHRDRGQRAAFSSGNNRLEYIWTGLTGILFLGTALASTGLWYDVHIGTLQSAPLVIETMAKQFAWNFRYPGPDGKFGKTELKLVNDAAGNPFGIDEQDAAGKDDIASAVLRVPAGQPVQLILRSRDVIHNFFVRELRMKQDLMPGMDIPFRFQADTPGEYEIACSELCGLGHHQMRSVLIVMKPAEFRSWLDEQARQNR